MRRPLAFFLPVPVGLESSWRDDLTKQPIEDGGMASKPLAKNCGESRGVVFLALAVNREAHGHAIGGETHVKAALVAALAPPVEDVQVVIGLVRGLVFAETNVAIDA